MDIATNPEKFWELYAEKLNEKAKEKHDIYEIYREYPSKWTEFIKEVAEDTIGKLLNSIEWPTPYKPKVDREYFRIDVYGYIKNYDSEQYDWELKIAYEHENNTDWDGELCKLCHIVADLKVIHSYYKPEKDICELLKKRVNGLGRGRIYGTPKNKWLFIFGAIGRPDIEHKAFTLEMDSKNLEKLNVIDITDKAQRVRPEDWKR